METVTDFIFLGSEIIADGDCSHEIKRHFILGRKAMTNLDSISKKAETLLCRQRSYSQSYGFWVAMYGCKSWNTKNAEHWRIDVFKLWCWKTLFRIPWIARSNQSILKEISPEYSLEGLMLKLKLQYFGHLMRRTDSLGKNPDAGKDWRQEEKGMTEDEMVWCHHQLDGHEFEQAPGDGEGWGSLACCTTWAAKPWAVKSLTD